MDDAVLSGSQADQVTECAQRGFMYIVEVVLIG